MLVGPMVHGVWSFLCEGPVATSSTYDLMIQDTHFFSNGNGVVVIVIEIAPETANTKFTMLWRLQIQDVQISDVPLKCSFYCKNLLIQQEGCNQKN